MPTAGIDQRAHTSCIRGPQEAVAGLLSQSCIATGVLRISVIESVRGISSTASRPKSMCSLGEACTLLIMFMPSKSTGLVLALRSLNSYEVGRSVGVGSDDLDSSTKDTVRGLGDRCPAGL